MELNLRLEMISEIFLECNLELSNNFVVRLEIENGVVPCYIKMATQDSLLYIETVQSESIKNLFETLREIIVDCNLICDSEGMHILSMNPSETTLVSLKLHAANFNVYHCARKLTMGINIPSINKLFKRIEKSDILTLGVNVKNEHELSIHIDNPSKKQSSHLNYKLLDIPEDEVELPDAVGFQSIIRMPSGLFQKLCRNMKEIDGKIEIRSSGDNIIFRCKGDFADEETVVGQVSDGDVDGMMIVNKESDEVVRGMFSLKSLLQFTKATSLHSSVEIFLKNEYPMIIQYPVADLGELKFALAPLSDE